MDRQELAKILLEMLEHETGEKYPDLSEAADLRTDLHLDSLDMVSTILQIEYRLKIDIATEELAKIAKVGDLLDLLEQKIAGRDDRQAA